MRIIVATNNTHSESRRLARSIALRKGLISTMYRHEAANAVSVNDKIEAVRSDGASLHRVIT